ncbi:MAG TPA: phosphoribosylanthranilate isomerase [Ramlibacter sp.]|uniref:phosphoribosylanthranilate isomerase n=1 Tax=Ramlibacter sp. TaxID=1917967 RepID=UPI002CD83D48|nr:phosphoribosylanthranilate isomerase [Ramlibacter sp.]HVZ46079.1 phosphoribosylanthranilate isomerase [Ramlibacter sp.]
MTPPGPLDHRTRIKICGLTREEDLDAAVDAGADAVGFVLWAKSPRCVSARRAGELSRRLPPFVTPVLLFVNASDEEVRTGCDAVPAALLQFHGDETPQRCLELARGRPYMRAARVPLDSSVPFDLLEFVDLHSQARAVLVDAHVDGYGGSGKTFEWSRLPTNVDCHLVLSGGLTPANVTDGIVQVRPRCKTLAVDVSSGVEAVSAEGAALKGIKDAAKIHRFVAAVRAADVLLARSTHALLSST